MTELEKICFDRFGHLSNEKLVSEINKSKDFGWDDLGVELNRRIESKLIEVWMDRNTLRIKN